MIFTYAQEIPEKSFLDWLKYSNTPLHQNLTALLLTNLTLLRRGPVKGLFSILHLIILRTRCWPTSKDFCTSEKFFMFLVGQILIRSLFNRSTIQKQISSFLKKLWCCVSGRVKQENLVLSNVLIKVELPQ